MKLLGGFSLFVLHLLNEARSNKLAATKCRVILGIFRVFIDRDWKSYIYLLLVWTKHSFIISGLSTSNWAVNISAHFKISAGDLIILTRKNEFKFSRSLLNLPSPRTIKRNNHPIQGSKVGSHQGQITGSAALIWDNIYPF